MNIERIATVLILALYPICTASAMQDEPDIGSPRSIRIVVSANFQEGNPIQGMPMTLFWTDQRMAGITDENGIAVIEIDVLPEVSWSDLRLFGRSVSKAGKGDKEKLKSKGELLRMIILQYSMEMTYHLEFDATVDDYEIQVTAFNTVAVTGVICDELGDPIGGTVVQGNVLGSIGGAIGGRIFTLSGVRKLNDTTIYAMSTKNWPITSIKAIDISGEKLDSNYSIGKIRVPDVDDAIPVSILLEDAMKYAGSSMGGAPGITCVSVYGEPIITYTAIRSSIPGLLTSHPVEAQLPEGKYYVVPGYFFGNVEQVFIIKSVLDGRDLSNSNIPTIEVRRGEANEFRFSLYEAMLAIQEYMYAREGNISTLTPLKAEGD